MAERRFFCTLADRNYLVRAMTLIESLRRHETSDYTLYFICLDELTRTVLRALALPNVVPIPLHAIEAGDESLRAARQGRTAVEYYWTLTPTIIQWTINHHPQIDVLTYLDADLFFFSSLDPIYAELGEQSILVHEHRFTPELAYQERDSGRFNVGLLSFRRDREGMAALQWWRESCNEWCFQRTEDGKFGDQMYLNEWPTRFRRLVILQNIGAGLAPWNMGNYRFGDEPGKPATVNDGPLVFFHFHSLQVPRPDVVLVSKHVGFPLTFEVLNACYAPYAEALLAQGLVVKALLPTFTFGLSEPVELRQSLVFLLQPKGRDREFGLEPCQRFPLQGGWEAWELGAR
ncbi:MAG TPA: hypothetical protein VH374_09755 [Polyangia bacterium]|jgi:hypothetical protein|nr:hypothetical protein [Polyangia bacterium]